MPDDLRICENHFTADCFLPDVKSKTGKLITKRLNRNMSIPSENLSKVFPTTELEERLKVKRRKMNEDENKKQELKEQKINEQKRNEQKMGEPKKYQFLRKCAVKGCENREATSTHHFPSDKHKERQEIWVKRCGQNVSLKIGKCCISTNY